LATAARTAVMDFAPLGAWREQIASITRPQALHALPYGKSSYIAMAKVNTALPWPLPTQGHGISQRLGRTRAGPDRRVCRSVDGRERQSAERPVCRFADGASWRPHQDPVGPPASPILPVVGGATAAPIRLTLYSGPVEAEWFGCASTWLASSLHPVKWVSVAAHSGAAGTFNGPAQRSGRCPIRTIFLIWRPKRPRRTVDALWST
jgi:hypothetical protein